MQVIVSGSTVRQKKGTTFLLSFTQCNLTKFSTLIVLVNIIIAVT